MTPDVNVLVAASRQDHPHHGPALRWLETARAGNAIPDAWIAAAALSHYVQLVSFDKGLHRLMKDGRFLLLKG